MKTLLKLTLTGATAAALAACSPFTSTPDGVDYKSAQRENALEVPPDLTRISSEGRFNLPDSANAYQTRQQAGKGETAATAVNSVGDVRIRSERGQHWLEVARPAGQLWEPVRSFWENNGFVLSSADRRVGVMETDWAENRANIPMDPLRRALGKALDSLYSTGELDRYRTRLESNGSGGTNIYITQRGMREVLTGRDKESTTWVDRPNDPGLENEMMRRLMIALGVSEAQATAMANADRAQRTAAPAATAPAAAAATAPANTPSGTLTLGGNPEAVWQQVGLSLDRAGFTVESRDHASGSYLLRYVTPTSNVKQPGFFGRLMGKKVPEAKPVHYRVQLQPAGADRTVVRVLDAQGQATQSDDANRILNVLAEDLKRR